MFIYYIATTPQSIVEIVNTGCFPPNLPYWLEPKRIVCTSNIHASVKSSNAKYQQIFILQLVVSMQLLTNCEAKILARIDPSWITQIFTYSEIGRKLLSNLFRNCQKIPKITIFPEAYSIIQRDISSPPMTSTKFFPQKRHRKDCFDVVSIPCKQKTKLDIQPIMELQRLSTVNEHLKILQAAFSEARKTILITSFAINHDTLDATNLYPLIEYARSRKVQIYFYYNDINQIAKNIYRDLIRLGAFCYETYTHSKILAVDHSWVALGSFNWLSGIDTRYPNNLNASIVCKGEVCQDLIEDLWEYLKHYRNIQFGNFWQAGNFERYNDCTITYEIARGEELSYLTTLEQHLEFFQDIFLQAKERIVICSPFISSVRVYEEDIDRRLLYKTISRGVDIFFVCSPSDPYLQEFNIFLASVKSSKIHLLTVTDFHLKTIVVDDRLIADGSFNWLSAVRDPESDFHNHETTLVVEGNIAKNLIANFYSSQIGSMILEQVYGNASMVKGVSDTYAELCNRGYRSTGVS